MYPDIAEFNTVDEASEWISITLNDLLMRYYTDSAYFQGYYLLHRCYIIECIGNIRQDKQRKSKKRYRMHK